MERGPLALFGAIVAVGLGPAMWLGAQFGSAIDVPAPAAVTSEHGARQQTQDKGGEAGSAPDTSVIIRTTPEANTRPLTPVRRRPGSSGTPEPAGSSSAPASSSASPSPSTSQSTPESGGGQSTPTDQPPGGSGQGDTQPPTPPAGQNPGSGSGGTGDGQPISG
jgi:hypothetical protein